jgi:hypothetical protein
LAGEGRCSFRGGFSGAGIMWPLDISILISGLFSRVGAGVILILNAFGINIYSQA